MKNITVSLDDEIYRQARVTAAQMDTSVTRLVREFLTLLETPHGKIAPEVPTKDKRGKMVLDVINQIRAKHPQFDPNSRLTREEAHTRR